jgi:hypothetical protein
MKRIKRISELFDNEDIKSELEIPFLKGDLGKDVLNKWNKYDLDENSFGSLMRKLVFKFPTLSRFNENILFIGESPIVSFFATSIKPIDEVDYYVQISLSMNEGKYYVNVILRELLDLEMTNWNIRNFTFNNIDDVYDIVNAFLKSSKHLNVIENIGRNSLEN